MPGAGANQCESTAACLLGVAFITAGAVALAIQAGLIPAATAQQAWRLWPLLLIVIGAAVIAARTPFGTVAVPLAGIVAGGMAGTLVAGFPRASTSAAAARRPRARTRMGPSSRARP